MQFNNKQFFTLLALGGLGLWFARNKAQEVIETDLNVFSRDNVINRTADKLIQTVTDDQEATFGEKVWYPVFDLFHDQPEDQEQ